MSCKKPFTQFSYSEFLTSAKQTRAAVLSQKKFLLPVPFSTLGEGAEGG